METLPDQLSTTNDLLPSRAGLVTIGYSINKIGFTDLVNRYFPTPNSNCGFQPSVFVKTFMLMLHNGAQCLDDVRSLKEEKDLCQLLNIKQIPEADSIGDWLRRYGQTGVSAVTKINRHLLQLARHDCKHVTLDIDASLSASKHREAKWTYKKCTGYMPMMGHIAETEPIVATDFRPGNIAPAKDNLAFIHQCEAALPEGVRINKLRPDAAGYQTEIIDECLERQIQLINSWLPFCQGECFSP